MVEIHYGEIAHIPVRVFFLFDDAGKPDGIRRHESAELIGVVALVAGTTNEQHQAPAE